MSRQRLAMPLDEFEYTILMLYRRVPFERRGIFAYVLIAMARCIAEIDEPCDVYH